MKNIRVLALFLAVLLVLMTAACGATKVRVDLQADQLDGLLGAFGGNAEVASASETPATQPTVQPATQPSSQQPSSEAPSSNTPSSEAPASETPASTPASETPAIETPASSTPSTKAEIIQYFVNAYNKIGSDATRIVRTYDYTSNYKGIVEVNNNERLAGLAKTLMDQFMKENFTEVEGDITKLHPVGLSTLTMTEAQVGAATLQDNGTTYTITLTSTGTDDAPETDCQPGQGSAGVIGPLLRTEDVSGAAGSLISFEGLHAYYPTGKVVATVDKASGHITNLDYECPCILHFDSVSAFIVVRISNANLGLLFQQKWTINY